MKKKKLTALIVSLCLIAAVGIGATLAYFTDNAAVENVVTMGHVDITLTENTVFKNEETGRWEQNLEGEEAITEEGLTFDGVLPGETVPKNPTITLVNDSVDAYVRIKMDVRAEKESTITEDDIRILTENLRNEITASPDWYYNADDQYYYFKNTMTNGEKAVLFESVTIPGEQWKNNTAGQSFAIVLQAEAIQADYFTPQTNDGGKITGWGDVDI